MSEKVPGLFMHGVLLAGRGMPIRDLFHLEKLSNFGKEQGRWVSFLSNTPLNTPGGVSSPLNCVAVF